MRRFRVLGFLLLLTLGCSPATTPGPAKAKADPPEVSVVRPQRKALVRRIEQPGAIVALEEAHLFARVPGNVGRLDADIGKAVEASEILAEISVPELDAESALKLAMIRQAEADVEQSRKGLAASEASIATADAMVVEANALFERWESESKRIAKLVQGEVIDAQTGDETRNQFRAAGARVTSSKAAVVKAKADRDKAASDVLSASARVDVAKADSRRLEAMRGYAQIRAPFAGVVTRRKVDTGDLVQPGKGDWLFTVARLDRVRVVVAVPEADAGLVKDGTKAKVIVPALGATLSGTIARTSGSLDPASRTLRAEIELPNADKRLLPGMYVYAHIEAVLPEAWTLPASAILESGDAISCFLVEDGKAVRTPLRIGRRDAGSVEVLGRRKPGTAEGWEAMTGEERVASPASGVVEGQAVAGK
jgi:multidrug efflux pump subunit AcrA (membrane-fusion protein)